MACLSPRKRIRRLMVVVVLVVSGGAIVAAQETSIRFDTVRTTLQPELEFRLPTGEIIQDTSFPIGEGRFDVISNFQLVTGGITGRVGFSRPIHSWEPFAQVGLMVDSEIPLSAGVAGELSGLNQDRMVERDRYIGGGVRWSALPGTIDLSTELRERVFFVSGGGDSSTRDVTTGIGWEIQDVRPLLPEQTPEAVGGFFRIEMEHRLFVDDATPVDLRGRLNALLYHRPFPRWRWEHRAAVYTPLTVWDRERSAMVRLGGFDSIRGVESGDVASRRAVVVGNTLAREVGPHTFSEEEELERVRVHSLRLLGVMDAAMYQRGLDVTDVPEAAAGVGVGVAGTVSAPGSIHLDVRVYVAAPVDLYPMPILYVRTSLFSLSADT